MIKSYRDLLVWQRSIELVIKVYQLTKKFPKEEMFNLTSQMRRAAVSIPSNIAEGKSRGTRKDFAQFIKIAFASGAELETQIEIAKQLSFATPIDYNETDCLLNEVMRMLNTLIGKLNSPPAN